MRLIERVGRLFGYQPEDEQTKAARRAEYQQQEKDYAKQTLYWLYVTGEARLSESAASIERLSRRYLNIDNLLRHRMRFESTPRQIDVHEDLMDMAIEKILDTVETDQDQRRIIKTEALKQARGFWEEELANPELTIDQRMLGRRRLTQIAQKLEQLEPPLSQQ